MNFYQLTIQRITAVIKEKDVMKKLQTMKELQWKQHVAVKEICEFNYFFCLCC